jgi:hypothetical protein
VPDRCLRPLLPFYWCCLAWLTSCPLPADEEGTGVRHLLGRCAGRPRLPRCRGAVVLKRWALWLTIVVSVINILSSAPRIAFAPTPRCQSLQRSGRWASP